MKTKLLFACLILGWTSCTKDDLDPELKTFVVDYNISGSYPINVTYKTNTFPVDTTITEAFSYSTSINSGQLCGFSSNAVGSGKTVSGAIKIDGVTRYEASSGTPTGDTIVWNGQYILLE